MDTPTTRSGSASNNDILRARDLESHRHRREQDALTIASTMAGYSAEDRAVIRSRVQELLPCKDEPAVWVPRLADPYDTPIRDKVFGKFRHLVAGAQWEQQQTMTAAPRSTGRDGHLHHFVPSPSDASEVYCVMCAETRLLSRFTLTGPVTS